MVQKQNIHKQSKNVTSERKNNNNNTNEGLYLQMKDYSNNINIIKTQFK
jgi:hypothetical protein